MVNDLNISASQPDSHEEFSYDLSAAGTQIEATSTSSPIPSPEISIVDDGPALSLEQVKNMKEEMDDLLRRVLANRGPGGKQACQKGFW